MACPQVPPSSLAMALANPTARPLALNDGNPSSSDGQQTAPSPRPSAGGCASSTTDSSLGTLAPATRTPFPTRDQRHRVTRHRAPTTADTPRGRRHPVGSTGVRRSSRRRYSSDRDSTRKSSSRGSPHGAASPGPTRRPTTTNGEIVSANALDGNSSNGRNDGESIRKVFAPPIPVAICGDTSGVEAKAPDTAVGPIVENKVLEQQTHATVVSASARLLPVLCSRLTLEAKCPFSSFGTS